MILSRHCINRSVIHGVFDGKIFVPWFKVMVLPEEIVFPLKAEYERMNSTIEGLKDNINLEGREIKDVDGDDRPPSSTTAVRQ
ncbi:hypothetical protein AK812_SmicGene37238 [Symbiodinium microadriaticum]|uniref:Uncharacterized protein n=1 Tax=Symbiodinium microadriaticum TaxID=2951 RepID=A0A1Q9CGR7_SYMMI|nr:hypothetical protein AK812_SmicGene37238 [Symbiodinium microadriaticum]CAE7205424.1 unnamed protein product [Symbiodinium sp. KB8]